jgi:predicted DsbA family dithiol-disulfide isomerase
MTSSSVRATRRRDQAYEEDGSPRVIEFWSDIGCPWASLAVHRFRETRSRLDLDGEVVLRHRVFPLELINGQGTPKETLDAELDVLLDLEPSLGWRPWNRGDWLYPGSMLLPLEAVQAASGREVGGLSAAEQLDAALRRAFYADSRPIGLHTEIVDVAAGIDGLDHAALSQCLESGTARRALFEDLRAWKLAGVQGSPHLVLPDGRHVHNPGVEIEWTQDDHGNWHLDVLRDDRSVYLPLLQSVAAR